MNQGAAILFALGAIAWLWHDSRTAHEKVFGVSRRVCRKLGVQHLDDTVSLNRLQIIWTARGPTVRRIYKFEFSEDGVNRNFGEIALLGSHLDWVEIKHPDGNYFVDSA